MRGIDARTQTVAKSSASTLTRNHNIGISHTFSTFVFAMKPRLGPDGPPRNSVTVKPM